MSHDRFEQIRTKRVGEIMIPLAQYPHVPETFTLGEAIAAMEVAQLEVYGRRSLPRLLLVFDKDDELVGLVRRRDLLRGLEPKYLKKKSFDRRQRVFDVQIDPNLLEVSPDYMLDGIYERANRSVAEVMIRDVITIGYDDHLGKAMYMMVDSDITSLPVEKDGRIVGVLRTVELFHEVAQLVMHPPQRQE